MKSKIILLSMFAFLTSCNLMTRQELARQEEQKQIVSNMQKNKADAELKYSDMQNDLRVALGKIDALEHQQQIIQQNHNKEVESLKKTIDVQTERIKLMQDHIDATEGRLAAAIGALKPGSSQASDNAPVPKKSSSNTPSLDEAEYLLGSKEYKKAIVKYQAYIDKNPKGKFIAEATYKIGVCFAELGLKKEAKEFYKDVIDNHASTSWAKKAKYRINSLK